MFDRKGVAEQLPEFIFEVPTEHLRGPLANFLKHFNSAETLDK